MTHKELMLGDKVFVKVLSQIPDTYIVHTWTAEDYSRPFLQVKPIPLTAEILKANGFRESSIEQGYYFPEKYQELNDRGFAVEEDNEGRFWITDHQLMKTRYFHKFQHALRLCGLWELAENFKV